MFDDRTNLAQQVARELRNYFGEKLCVTTIPRNIRLAEAPSHGKPALIYDVRSRGAESYIRLAKELIERSCAVQVVSAPGAEAVGEGPVAVAEASNRLDVAHEPSVEQSAEPSAEIPPAEISPETELEPQVAVAHNGD